MDELLRQLRANPAFADAEKRMNDAIYKKIIANRDPNRIVFHGNLPATPITLPVVVHIINENPASITDAMVAAGIQNLNDAFSKSGPYAASKGVNTMIRFVLAKKDPKGGFTTGITRTETRFGVNFNMYNEDIKMKNLSIWNPAKYINIWLVQNMVGELGAGFSCGIWRRTNVGGYAYLPIPPPYDYSTNTNDGIVIPNFGPVLAHEMGHYLGLYHTFDGGCNNNNCLTDGDRVCDTPPDATSDPSTNCNQPGNSCGTDTLSNYSNGFFPRDTTDLERNFMDYSDQSCQNQFTEGQAERMHAAVATQRPGLIGDAITAPAPCTGSLVAGFTRSIANPKPTETITFTNTTIGSPVAYEWKVDGAVAHTGSILPPRTFPDASFPYFKKHEVTLKVTDASGCVSSFTDFVITNCGITARFSNNKRFIASQSGLLRDTILFTNNSMTTIGPPVYQWVLVNTMNNQRISVTTNAAGAGGANDLNYEFPNHGNFNVRLIASAAGCADSIDMFIPVADPRQDAYMALIGANCFANTKVRATFYVCNFGYDTIMPGLPVTFYDDDPTKPTARKIGTSYIIPDTIAGICCGRVYIDTLDVGYEKLDKLYAVANNVTSSVPIIMPDPGVTLIEKEYGNNIASYTGFRYKAVINPATASMAPGDTLQLNAQGMPDGSNSFAWGPSGNFSCATCPTTFYYADTTPVSTKRVIVKSHYQCTDTGYIDIKVPPYNDFTVSIGGISCSPNEDSLFVDFTVGNLFKRGIIPKNIEVAFYRGDPRTGTAVPLGSVFKAPDSVAAKQKAYRIKIKKTRNSRIYASVNDKGTVVPVVPANAPFTESVYTNNFDSAIYQPVIVSTVDTAICSGLSFRGHSVTGVYRDTSLSVGGCDSISIINLTVKAAAAVQTTISVTLCEGENYAGHTTSGTYVETYTGSNTCDSIRTLHLTVNPIVRVTRNVKICIGKSFFAAGKQQTEAGTYIDSAKSVKGCDSIVTTILTVDPLIPVRYTVSICQGTAHPAAGKMQTESGVYTDTTLSSAGCDSITITTLTVRPIIRADYNVGICRGESYLAGGSMQTQSGVYSDFTKTAGGCDSVTVTHLSVNPLPARFLPEDTTLCIGRPLTINLIGFTSINWSTGSTLNTVTLTQAGTYSVQVIDRNGCAGSDAIVVDYKKCIPLQVPSAFTPNNDGLNDDFKPMIGVVPTNFIMQIFNRWGTLMFETHDPNKGWNGKVAGQLQPPGTYVYSISLTDIDGTMASKKGTLILIR